MEKQRNLMHRWLILTSKALLIYKDQVGAKSFPLKPLYAIPLPEIKQIDIKEVNISANPRKS